MTNKKENEAKENGISRVTAPLYKTLLVSLAILYLFGKEMDGSVRLFLVRIAYILLALIFAAQISGLIAFFKNRKKTGA
ncbi:MAG: hypothetical protein HYZ14_10300 [Bacteroidetes bacterium]|nr:hypothetical protein [Bacteroidota bacterium]